MLFRSPRARCEFGCRLDRSGSAGRSQRPGARLSVAPVTIMVPLAAGTGMDTLVRLYADKLPASLGKPVIVENKPGAALMLAAPRSRTAPADGHTLLVSTSVADGDQSRPLQEGQLRHRKDFTPISLYVKSPFILVVNPDLPIKTVPDLIKLCQGAARTARPIRRPAPASRSICRSNT